MWSLEAMEPIDAGILSLLPPFIALILAFITKEVITSILSGVLVGTIIYTIKCKLPWYEAISIVISLLVEKMSGSDYIYHFTRWFNHYYERFWRIPCLW